MELAAPPAPDPVAPLCGYRVVEAGSYLSAPFASMMLAELGAHVVKVEAPGGDQFRRFSLREGGTSATWISVNHGKESITLDLKREAGRAALLDELARADVFLHNWRPSVATSLDLDVATLEARFPSLVQVSISGFGEEGPRSRGPVFDGLLQAASGFSAREGDAAGPRMTRSFLVDKTTALFASQGILAALLARQRTGRGCHLALSMLDVMAYFNFPDLGQDRTFLPPAPARDLPLGRAATLRTSDGHLVIAPVSGRQVRSALEVVGHPEWRHDLKQIGDPVRFLDELLDRLETVTVGWTTAACEERFLAADVPAVAVLSFDEHLADPQTVHNDIYTSVETAFGPVRRVRHPLRTDGRRLPDVASAPALAAEPTPTAPEPRSITRSTP